MKLLNITSNPMKFNYSILFTFVFLWFQNSYSQFTEIINTNRPGESFGAFSVGKRIIQVEGGLSYLHEKYKKDDSKTTGIVVDLDLRYGFWREQLEFIADLQYRNDKFSLPDEGSTRRSYLKSTVLGFKYLVYDPYRFYEEKVNIYSWKENNKFKWRELIPVVALYAGANINSSSNPYLPKDESIITPKAALLLQNNFTGGWVVVTNAIVDQIGSDYQTISGILTVTKSLNMRWSGFVEFQAHKNDFYKDVVTRAGGVYILNEDLQLDVSLGKNFNSTRNIIYGGLGVSWRFTVNYKDTMMYRVLESDTKEPDVLKEEETEEVAEEALYDEDGNLIIPDENATLDGNSDTDTNTTPSTEPEEPTEDNSPDENQEED